MPVDPIRIFLIDDHRALTQAYSLVFANHPEIRIVAVAHHLGDARAQFAAGLQADVAFVDLQLPDGSGLELIPELCAANRGMYAIVLSGTINARSRALAVAAGASGILDKAKADPESIVEAARAVCRGEPLISPSEAVALMQEAEQFRREERAVRSAVDRLTPREREILQAIAEGLSDKEIAARLYLSDRTVRNHVVALLAKLDVDSRLQALVLAARSGAVRLH
jgi:RNA polymerase sigma factor (sigma-70 family)